jgi:predicted RNase H-like HicB family nuclease
MYIMYMQWYDDPVTRSVAYDTLAEARAHIKDLVDAAVDGVPARFRRDDRAVVLVDAERLRAFLARDVPQVEAVAEAHGWSLLIPEVPVAADGATFDEAVDEMALALREYVEDWVERLRTAPNHRANWALVQLVSLSSDEQLGEWIAGKSVAMAAAAGHE